MSPSISIRDSIRWLPEPASEPTRTVVLTSPENRFVDIRILRPPPQLSEKDGLKEDHLPLERLDWAFAGTSSSTASSASQTGHIAHSKWRHWIDSRHVHAEDVSDEGDMFALSDRRTLEKGAMVNPATGRMMEYEEVWRDVGVIATSTVSPQQARQTGGEAPAADERKRTTCTALVLENEAVSTRGMVIQLGQFCQGVLRYGDHFSLERWVWHESGGWRREVSIGREWLPCGVVTGGEEKVPQLGGVVQFGGFEWLVVEKGEI